MSTLADLMTSDVLTVAPEDTIGETAQQMVELGVSSAVVSDYGRLIGIVTERDLTRAVAGPYVTTERSALGGGGGVVFTRTVAAASKRFAVTMSGILSPFRSPLAMKVG